MTTKYSCHNGGSYDNHDHEVGPKNWKSSLMHLMMTISMIIMSLMMIVMMKSLMILTQKIQAVTSTSCQVRSSDSYFLTPFSLYTFDEDNHDYYWIQWSLWWRCWCWCLLIRREWNMALSWYHNHNMNIIQQIL